MSQIHAPTSLVTAPPRISVPGGYLSMPAGINAPAAALAGVAGGLADIALERERRLAEADAANALTMYRADIRTAIGAAQQAATEAPIEGAEKAYSESIAGALADRDQSLPPIARERASAVRYELTQAGLLDVRQQTYTRREQRNRANFSKSAETSIELVRTNHMTADEAIAQTVEDITPHIGTAYTQEQAESIITGFRAAAVNEYAYALDAAGDPAAAIDYLTHDQTAIKSLDGADRARRVEHFTQQKETKDRAEAERIYQDAADAMDAALGDGWVPPTQLQISSILEDLEARYDMPEAYPGFQVRGLFVPNRVATKAELRIALLAQPLQTAADAGDFVTFEALASQLPKTSDANALEQKARDTMRRQLVDRRTLVAAAGTLGVAFAQWVSNPEAAPPAGLPNSAEAVKSFVQDQGNVGIEPAATHAFLAAAGLDTTPIKTFLDTRLDESTRDLPAALNTLYAVGAANRAKARNLASGATGNATIASSMLELSEFLPASDILAVFDNPGGGVDDAIMDSRELFYRSTDGKITDFDISKALAPPASGPLGITIGSGQANITEEVHRPFEAAFHYFAVQGRTQRGISDDASLLNYATGKAAEFIHARFTTIEATPGSKRDLLLIPSQPYGLGADASPNPELTRRFQHQLNIAMSHRTLGIIGNTLAGARPDITIERSGPNSDQVFFPIFNEFGLDSFGMWDVRDRTINIITEQDHPEFITWPELTGALRKQANIEGVTSWSDVEYQPFLSDDELDRRRDMLVERVERQASKQVGGDIWMHGPAGAEYVQSLINSKARELRWPISPPKPVKSLSVKPPFAPLGTKNEE